MPARRCACCCDSMTAMSMDRKRKRVLGFVCLFLTVWCWIVGPALFGWFIDVLGLVFLTIGVVSLIKSKA